MYKALLLAVFVMTTCSCSEAKTETVKLEPPKVADAALSSQRSNGNAYELAGTEVWDVADPKSGRKYQVFVSLPKSYQENPDRHYPVLYVTDADYGFPIVRQISRRLNGGSRKLDDFILVGLSYAVGEDSMNSRRRDYTPSPAGAHDAPPDAVHGESNSYISYLRDAVFPFVAARYRTNENRRMFLGHSYGGLLGLDILFSASEMFSGYIIGSPSIWYDKNVMEGVERKFAGNHQDLKASVYMYVGEYEDMRPGDPRYAKRYNMVSDARRMERILSSRSYPSLHIKLDVLNDEDHQSVAPRGFTKGLQFLLAAETE